jgi:ubiquinone/menaquinone biosynthesis C-methylase UbiE
MNRKDLSPEELKALVRNTFDTVAEGYGNPSMQFFHAAATMLPEIFEFKGDENVLDVAAGTGIPACKLAAALPRGKVTGIDFSAKMLQRASQLAREQSLDNVDFKIMDMTAMEFADNSFDAANCSFGLFFVEDMLTLLQHISDKVKPDGRITCCSFFQDSFSPLTDIFFDRLREYGVEPPDLSWKRICEHSSIEALFQQAGLEHVQTQSVDVSYHLADVEQWWDIVWYAGFRSLVEQIDASRLPEFRQRHLAEIADIHDDDGIPLKVQVLYATGITPRL